MKSNLKDGECVNVLGVRVHPVSLESVADTVLRWALEDRPGARYVCVSGMHGIMEAQGSREVHTILNRADLNVPDGMPLVFLGRFAGFDVMGRVFGPDLMHEVLKRSASRGLSHFFYGGNEGVAEDLARKMQSCYEGIRVAGTFCPPFRSLNSTEADQVVDMINAMNPDIVWVGLSTPKQELWMAEFSKRLKARVLLGVGAAFDYNTDRLRRAPHWMQGLALEWLYRLIQEPKRLYKRYLVNGPVFLYRVLLQILGIRGYPVDTGSNKDSF